MAKQPELKTIDDGWYERQDLNENFRAISKAFEDVLWRSARDGESLPETPNFMEVDFDVSDANITNVRQLIVNSMQVANNVFAGFGDERYVEQLAALSCNDGAIITHLDGRPVCREAGDNGEVLKSRSGSVQWEEDLDTDTNTVGVTVQEDGVTVAENVTTIDFKWPGGTLVTTPVGNQVDLEMELLLGPLFEDTTQADSNLNPSSDVIFNNTSEITRLDLINDVGLASVTSADQVWAIAEASNGFRDSGLAGGGLSPGQWRVGCKYYQDDGTSTPGTGTEVVVVKNTQFGNTNGGNLLTFYEKIPANVRYVDFAWSLVVTSPFNLNDTEFCDRYRAIINHASAGTFETPQGYTSSQTNPKTCPV